MSLEDVFKTPPSKFSKQKQEDEDEATSVSEMEDGEAGSFQARDEQRVREIRSRGKSFADGRKRVGEAVKSAEVADEHRHRVQLKKFDDELQVVWGEVYLPNFPDSQDDFMTAEEVRDAAYSFMGQCRMRKIDTMHDNVENGSFVVESFIAMDGQTTFIPGAWVVGVHIPDTGIWGKVKSGELNGFSMEALAIKTATEIIIEVPEVMQGVTERSGDTMHTHKWHIRFSPEGEFLGGSTGSVLDGDDPDPEHDHKISKGTVTEQGGENPHRHRYSFVEVAIGG